MAPIYHALKVDESRCRGCSHCMGVCPTGAIRMRKGKPYIFQDRCIDCGKCYRICPESAIDVEEDAFGSIFSYKKRIALLPPVLGGQFPDTISKAQIDKSLFAMGFTDLFEVGEMWPVFRLATARYIKENPHQKPLISPFCPAVLRLIQIHFPSLVEHIIPMKPPVEMAAFYCREKFRAQGYGNHEIGTFYITPCAAKISSVKSPCFADQKILTGVINMDTLTNRMWKRIGKERPDKVPSLPAESPCEKGILWFLTAGESDYAPGRSLAIDGIANVREFLEDLENQEISDIDFLELRSCDESCAGGVLTTCNRFLTVERLRNRAWRCKKSAEKNPPHWSDVDEKTEELLKHIFLAPIEPHSVMKLDEDLGQAMVKMEKMQKILHFLPGVDCGLCGSPSCRHFAEDIVNKDSRIEQCVFVQKKMMAEGRLAPKSAEGILNQIWGAHLDHRKEESNQ